MGFLIYLTDEDQIMKPPADAAYFRAKQLL